MCDCRGTSLEDLPNSSLIDRRALHAGGVKFHPGNTHNPARRTIGNAVSIHRQKARDLDLGERLNTAPVRIKNLKATLKGDQHCNNMNPL